MQERTVKFNAWKGGKMICDVDPCVTGLQYTEVSDKDGGEIYQADIVKLTDHVGGKYIIGEVCMKWGKWSVLCDGVYTPLYSKAHVIEKLGNIFEHKNLLK